jgi:hypothetical protein
MNTLNGIEDSNIRKKIKKYAIGNRITLATGAEVSNLSPLVKGE